MIKASEIALNLATPVERTQARWRVMSTLGGRCEPDCETCQGIGGVRVDVDLGHPLFGKIVPCPNSKPSFERAGLHPTDTQLTWNSLKEINNVLDAKSVIQRVVERGSGWVYLWGEPGLGKTLLLRLVVAEAIRAGIPAAYARMTDILENMRSAYDERNASAEASSRLEFWTGLPLLCIDEFDRFSGTEWANEKRFKLMDERYDQATHGEGITIMASNGNPASFDSYLKSRIYDHRFAVIKLAGVDARRLMDWTV